MGLLVLVFMPLDTALSKAPVPSGTFWQGIGYGLMLLILGIILERKRPSLLQLSGLFSGRLELPCLRLACSGPVMRIAEGEESAETTEHSSGTAEAKPDCRTETAYAGHHRTVPSL